MRIFYASDLHIEFEDNRNALQFDELAADLVILAGDIGVGTDGIEWAAASFSIPIIYVPGNHEFYHHDYHELRARSREIASKLGVHLLDEDTIEIDGIRFAGCTLWTDYQVNGTPQFSKTVLEDVMPDHRCITSGKNTLWTPELALETHQNSVAWLAGLNNIDVVVTHHCPSLTAIGHIHPQNQYTPGFISDLDWLIEKIAPRAWVFGHHHCCVDVIHPSGARIVSNQHGYPHEDRGTIGWNQTAILEIG